ncbi:LOW QUALITY PROTEIN: OPRK-like protein [Mya arenaria]|uniref:OPRK-like protein n=1 Tax=Mya arenaria TaxID=6604 RepID=A0ABY7GEN1_MYAAR|nr:LOW QUALITY PROTEIN: OPRK-like protein [Mya arenaria]
MTVCLLSLFSVCGIIGNTIVLGIYRSRRHTTARLFIITLAIGDICSCLTVIPLTVLQLLDFKLRYDIVCKAYEFLITCNTQFSVFLMVIISIDRYLCICHPLTSVINTLRAKVIVICLLSITFVFGILSAWCLKKYMVCGALIIFVCGIQSHDNVIANIIVVKYFVLQRTSISAREGGVRSVDGQRDNRSNIASLSLRVTDTNLISNIRTAASVTDFNMTIFYMYFISNASNPFIYVFMSRDFRRDFKNTLKASCWKK